MSAILRYCNEHKIAVTPQGGNTGVVAGGVPLYDEVIISASLMNKIIKFDELSGKDDLKTLLEIDVNSYEEKKRKMNPKMSELIYNHCCGW